MAEINVTGFSGANNVKDDEKFFSKSGIAEPRIILNADFDVTDKLTKRFGKTLLLSLANGHSLWSGNSCMLCAADNVLYRIYQNQKINIGTVIGPKYPFSYVDAEDKVYISNPYWQGVFDPSDNSISSWGTPQPPGPVLLVGSGSLPAGTYHVCMTNVVGDEISGNGPITDIELISEGGIQILNRPSGALAWITDANEPLFYLVGETSKIVDIPTVEPLPTFLCSPPPYMENLCYAFGRIWGSVGPMVYYCLPFKLGLFRLSSNRYKFEDTVTMIAKSPTGLFIGTNKSTKFLKGTIPEEMEQMDAGAGSIKGTLVYCNNMPELGWTLGTPEKDFTDVPVWMTTEGVVVGSGSGKLFNLTKNKIKMPIPSRGAALYRNKNGVIQYLTNFRYGSTGNVSDDTDLYNAFKTGKLDVHSKYKGDMGSRTCFSDTVTCKVYRNSEEI